MSGEARPIDPARFAEAIKELPVSSLNSKAAEIRNSIAHLRISNDQLQEFADAGDRDCADAIKENEDVMTRMEQRIALLKAEVEARGLRWYEDHADEHPAESAVAGGTTLPNGLTNGASHPEDTDAPGTGERRGNEQRATSGRLTDEQLQRMLAERLGEPSGDDEDSGIHL